MAVLIGIGAIAMAPPGRRDDIVTTGITTEVVMVVAAINPANAWQQPLLRLADTVVGSQRPLRASGTVHTCSTKLQGSTRHDPVTAMIPAAAMIPVTGATRVPAAMIRPLVAGS
jgi:hypothetical protein